MNDLMQRRKQQMQQAQQMVEQQSNDGFSSWYNAGSQLGGAVFGNMASAKNDGKYNGENVYGAGKTDKEKFTNMQNMREKFSNQYGLDDGYRNVENRSFGNPLGNGPDVTSFGITNKPNETMANVAQSGDNYIGVSSDGDTNIDAIGAFVNGYQQASQPDVVGLQQGLQMGQNAVGNMANKQYGFDPNWRIKLGGRF